MNPFLLGVFVSRLGDAFSFLAMILILSKQGAAFSMVSLFMVAHYLPGVLIGNWGRRWFDCLPKKNTLILAYSVSAGLTLAITPALNSPWSLLGLSTLLGVAYGVYVPLQKAFIAEIFAPEQVRRANSAVQIAETLAKTLGFGAAGLVFHRLGPTVSFSMDAVSFVAIAFLFTRVEPLQIKRQNVTPSHHHAIAQSRVASFDWISSAFSLTWLGTGVLFALEAGYARSYLQASETGIGILFACATLGSLAVPYLLSQTRYSFGPSAIAMVCLCETAFVAAYGVSSAWIPAIACIIAYGCTLTARHILANSWVHENIPQSEHGSAFAQLQAKANLAMMLGMGLSGPVAGWIGIRATMTGAATLSAAGILFASLRPLERRFHASHLKDLRRLYSSLV